MIKLSDNAYKRLNELTIVSIKINLSLITYKTVLIKLQQYELYLFRSH